ncbi:MAG: BadF/BadG/BcrA/BcrD ATPase family protein, partial [Desulfobacteraceae bacterium]
AGTGRFFEVIAKRFDIALEDIGPLAQHSTQNVRISNICAVFAESEVISLLSQGVLIEDILRAVGKAVAKRVIGLADRVGINDAVMFCGGVAKNISMISILEELLSRSVILPEHIEFVGAIGAALQGLEQY